MYLSVCAFHKMELSLLLLTFALLWKPSTSIRCYQCVAELTHTAVEVECDHFDGSEKFIVDCPDSNMCYKRITALNLNNGITSKSHQRGCAAQTISGDQKKINGKWQMVHDIHDVYNEDCKPDDTYADRITKTVHCYCRGELCNGSGKQVADFSAVLLTSVIVMYFATT